MTCAGRPALSFVSASKRAVHAAGSSDTAESGAWSGPGLRMPVSVLPSQLTTSVTCVRRRRRPSRRPTYRSAGDLPVRAQRQQPGYASQWRMPATQRRRWRQQLDARQPPRTRMLTHAGRRRRKRIEISSPAGNAMRLISICTLSMLLAVPAAQAADDCDRACLKSMLNQYLSAVAKHDPCRGTALRRLPPDRERRRQNDSAPGCGRR